MRILLLIILVSIAVASAKANDQNNDSIRTLLFDDVKSMEYDSLKNMRYSSYSDYLRRTNPLQALNFQYEILELTEKYNNLEYRSNAYVSIGTLYHDQGLNGRALENFYNATKYFDGLSYGYYCWIHIFIGNVYYSEQLFDEAINIYSVSDAAFDSLSREDKRISDIKDNLHFWNLAGKAVANNNIGLCYRRMQENDSAMHYFQKAMDYRKAQKQVFGIAHSHLYLGEMYVIFKDYDKALSEFKIAGELLDSALKTGYISIIELKANKSKSLFSIGMLYEKMNQKEKAEEYIYESIDSLLSAGDRMTLTSRYLELANFYLRHKKNTKSIRTAEKALNIALENKLYNSALSASMFLFDSHKKLNQFKEATAYSEIYNSISDSIQKKFNEFSIKEVTTRVKAEDKLKDLEKDKIIKEFNLKQQSEIIIYLSIFIFIVLIAVLVVWRQNIHKRKLNLSLEDKNVELLEVNATKDKFFSIIAHDLKNPFGNFKNVLELLESKYDSFDEEDKKEFLADLKHSSHNLYELLENLLTWSRSQRGIIDYNPENENIKLIVESNINFLQLNANEKNIALHSLIQDDIFADFDLNMMNTVLRNLISNAIKFTPEKGRITVSAKANKGEINIVVEDTGVGISPDNLNKLFKIDKSFSSLGTNSEKGTGLGLILCKEFIDKHNGRIWAESKLGEGTVFYISIPSKQL